MFEQTRRKIVFTVVFSLLALMTVTLTTIYLSSRAAAARENREMLHTFAERFSPYAPPALPDGESGAGEKPAAFPSEKDELRDLRRGRPEKFEPAFRLATFYAVAYDKDGEVLTVETGNNGVQSEETLTETAAGILKTGQTEGKVGSMTYLVDAREDYTLVAMIDGTVSDRYQSRLFWQMIRIGAASTVILFAISVVIARRIVRPLEENDKRQKRFVSDAGHELKTPIAVISANSDLLRREWGDSEWLGNIDYENRRMQDLVGQLLALSRAEGGAAVKETLDFSKLTLGEVFPFETLAFERGVTITSDIDAGLYVSGDKNRLCQLVSILLDNAISHGNGKEILVSLKRQWHFAVLTVENDAEELGAEQLSHLFDRFYRTDAARSGEDGHYGLGLSIAQAVTKAHGGKIRASYLSGRAVFTVSLPLKKN